MGRGRNYDNDKQRKPYKSSFNNIHTPLVPCRVMVAEQDKDASFNSQQFHLQEQYVQELDNLTDKYSQDTLPYNHSDNSQIGEDYDDIFKVNSCNKNSNNSNTVTPTSQVNPISNFSNYPENSTYGKSLEYNVVPLQECPLRMSKSDAEIMKKVLKKCKKRDKCYMKSLKTTSSRRHSIYWHPSALINSLQQDPLTQYNNLRNHTKYPSYQEQALSYETDGLSKNNSNRCQERLNDNHCKRKNDVSECCYYESPLHRELKAQCLCIISQCRHLRKRPVASNTEGDSGNTTTSDEDIKEESINRCQIDDVTSDMRIGYLFRYGCKKIKKTRRDFAKEAAQKIKECHSEVNTSCNPCSRQSEVTYRKTTQDSNCVSASEMSSHNNCTDNDNGFAQMCKMNEQENDCCKSSLKQDSTNAECSCGELECPKNLCFIKDKLYCPNCHTYTALRCTESSCLESMERKRMSNEDCAGQKQSPQSCQPRPCSTPAIKKETCAETCSPPRPQSCSNPGKLVLGTHIKTAKNHNPCATMRCGRASRLNSLLNDEQLINKYGRDSFYCVDDDFKIVAKKTPRCKPVTCNKKNIQKESACVTAASISKACKKALKTTKRENKKKNVGPSKCKKRKKQITPQVIYDDALEPCDAPAQKKERKNIKSSCNTGKCEQPSIDMALTSVVDVIPEPLRSMALDKHTKRVECFGDNCMIM